MADPLLFVSLVPLLSAGAVSLAAAGYIYIRGPRTPLLNAFTALLVFLSHLAFIGTLFLLPGGETLALRLWPVFQLAGFAATLAALILLYDEYLDERRIDTLLSTVVGGCALLVGLVLWIPEFYWGEGLDGPLHTLDGVRAATWAVLAWLLAAHALSDGARFPLLPRPVSLVLAAALLIGALHPAVTAGIIALWTGKMTSGFEIVALPPLVGLVLDVAWRWRRHEHPEVRALARRFLLGFIAPVTAAVSLLAVAILGLVTPVLAGFILIVVLQSVWSLALPLALVRLVRHGRPRPRHEPDARPSGAAVPVPHEY